MDCDSTNLGSSKTIKSLGGIMVREYYDDEEYFCDVQDYIIDVDKAIENNKNIYEPYITGGITKWVKY